MRYLLSFAGALADADIRVSLREGAFERCPKGQMASLMPFSERAIIT
jgi:hypothetical protein